jgi:hypothetical protein
MATSEGIDRLRAGCGANARLTMTGGAEGLVAVATHPSVDIVICASSGTAGLEAVLAAIAAGKTIALANKEALVTAGALMIDAAHRTGATILPVDSEHNAIFQCLAGSRPEDVARIILTASGGPFRNASLAEMEAMTPEQAVRDYYHSLEHHVPHHRRMWLLLSAAGRISGDFGSFEGFRRYWQRRLADLRGNRVAASTPLVFEIENFKSDRSEDKRTADARFTVVVAARGRRAEGPIATIPVTATLARGPDNQWYLDRGTLPAS